MLQPTRAPPEAQRTVPPAHNPRARPGPKAPIPETRENNDPRNSPVAVTWHRPLVLLGQIRTPGSGVSDSHTSNIGEHGKPCHPFHGLVRPCNSGKCCDVEIIVFQVPMPARDMPRTWHRCYFIAQPTDTCRGSGWAVLVRMISAHQRHRMEHKILTPCMCEHCTCPAAVALIRIHCSCSEAPRPAQA